MLLASRIVLLAASFLTDVGRLLAEGEALPEPYVPTWVRPDDGEGLDSWVARTHCAYPVGSDGGPYVWSDVYPSTLPGGALVTWPDGLTHGGWIPAEDYPWMPSAGSEGEDVT